MKLMNMEKKTNCFLGFLLAEKELPLIHESLNYSIAIVRFVYIWGICLIEFKFGL